jgi:thiol-disulfide isomerase/thioredoxin
MLRFIKLALGLILANGFLALVGCSGGTSAQMVIDSPAPDFKLSNLEGQTISLSSFLGKPIFINFWTTTCGPCVQEMPYLQQIQNDWASKGLIILSVNLGEDADRVENFIRSHNYSFPVLLDSQYVVAGKYNVRYTPTSIFIDTEGKIKADIIGAFKNTASIEKEIETLIH